MVSLFIDTSLDEVSIALLKENKLLTLIKNDIPGEHSIYVSKYIEDILKNNNIDASNVNEIVVVNGPGSFTGIRIGVTIAKVFAYLEKIRIVTITSLRARAIGNSSKYILSTINAKNDNYYVGLYDKEYNVIFEKFSNKKEIEEIKNKYNPLLITEENKYDIEKIVLYTKRYKSMNYHLVNPIYLKDPVISGKKC